MAYTFLDLASEILKQSPKPMTYQEIWSKATELGVSSKIKTSGKTPWQTLGALLYVDVRDNPGSVFIKVDKRPARFFLKGREKQLSIDIVSKIDREEITRPAIKTTYHERDLHPLLSYYAYSNPSFNRGRSNLLSM